MRTDQFRRNGEAQARYRPAGSSRKGLEQMLSGAGREAGPGIRNLNDNHPALRRPVSSDLIAQRIVRRPRFHCLRGVAGEVQEHPENLVVVGVNLQTPLD